MAQLRLDHHGHPELLADPPVKEVAPPESVSPSTPPVVPSARPAAVDHVEWSRRQDAVREAAREFEDLSEQDLKERLRGVTSKPLDDQALIQFRADVRAVVLDDLLDVLDQKTRGKLRGRRTVRLNAPVGYTKKAMRSLTKDEADQLESRLRSRGWTDAQIKDDLRGKLGHLDAPAPVS